MNESCHISMVMPHVGAEADVTMDMGHDSFIFDVTHS